MIFENKNKTDKLSEEQEKLAERISSSLVGSQRRFATRLNRWINSYTPLQLKIGLFIFCIAVGSVFLYLIITSLFFT